MIMKKMHNIYHRELVIMMVRELGVTTIPATDMIVYFREKN